MNPPAPTDSHQGDSEAASYIVLLVPRYEQTYNSK